MRCVSVQILLILSLSLGSVGCVYQGRLSIRRVWADLNTLNEPALFYERIDHFPYRAAEVDHFRWMYNTGPNPRVPYQVIPEGALEESLHPHCEVPAWNCPTCITPDAMPLRVSPGVNEDSLPPVPGYFSQPRKEIQQAPAGAERTRRDESFRPVSHYEKAMRPSMTSNQPIGLLGDETSKTDRRSAFSRFNRWFFSGSPPKQH
jgi:hypothetical protein